MHVTDVVGLSVLAALLVAPAIDAGSSSGSTVAASFDPPADAVGDARIDRGSWAIMFFESHASRIRIESSAMTVIDNAYPAANAKVNGTVAAPHLGAIPTKEEIPSGRDVVLEFGDWGKGWLAIHAGDFKAEGLLSGQLLPIQGANGAVQQFPDSERGNPFWTNHAAVDAGPALVAHPDQTGRIALNLAAVKVDRVVWFGARTACDEAPCPPGGGWRGQRHFPPGAHVELGEYHYLDAKTKDGRLEGVANVTGAIIGGPLTLELEGLLRMPNAQVDGCEPCNGGTLQAKGTMTLANLVVKDGRLTGQFGGDLSALRLDEAPLDPALLTGAGAAIAVASVGVLVLLKALLATLFTKKSEPEALANDRRRRMHDYVSRYPGIHFREALRGTGIPSGSGRHHVTHLVRSGLLVERRIGSKLRLFVAGQESTAVWQDTAVRANEALRLLHEWVSLHPDQTQMDILEAFRQLHSWNKSTTQGRLARLVRDGALNLQERGRYKHYRATRPVALTELTRADAIVPA